MIIGISGKKRSGKNTAGKVLEDLGFKELTFAGPLKRHLEILDPIVDYYEGRLSDVLACGGWEYAKTFPEVRRLLQVYGTGIGRNLIRKTLWVDLAEEEMKKHKDVFFSDLRFENEAEMLRGNGAVLIRITRPNLAHDNHASETALDEYSFDHYLENDGSVAELHEKMHGIFAR